MKFPAHPAVTMGGALVELICLESDSTAEAASFVDIGHGFRTPKKWVGAGAVDALQELTQARNQAMGMSDSKPPPTLAMRLSILPSMVKPRVS